MARRVRSEVRLDTNHLDRLVAEIPKRARGLVGGEVRAIAQIARLLAPVDTGALKASIYTVTPDQGSTYPLAIDEAKLLRPEAVLLPEVELRDSLAGTVGVGVQHGIYNEFGTTQLPASPFLGPAIETVKATMRRRWGRLFGA